MRGFAWGAGGIAVLFLSCRDFTVSYSELSAKRSAPAAGPDCRSCHDYPLHDVHHEFHLFFKTLYPTAGRTFANCRDCHARSIRGDTLQVADTIFQDPVTSNVWSSWYNPDSAWIRGLPILDVQTLAYIRALEAEPAGGEAPRLQEFREWMTGPAHFNGVVDVDFDEWVDDTARFGRRAVFHPEQQTCSAIRCHGEPLDYRWAAPSKGLGPLKGYYPDST